MHSITDRDVLYVYEQLKNHSPVVLTTTAAMDTGFTIDCPIIIGYAHEQIMQLYAYENMFIMDVMNADQTMGTHWHPTDCENAIAYFVAFMDGKSAYPMYPLGYL